MTGAESWCHDQDSGEHVEERGAMEHRHSCDPSSTAAFLSVGLDPEPLSCSVRPPRQAAPRLQGRAVLVGHLLCTGSAALSLTAGEPQQHAAPAPPPSLASGRRYLCAPGLAGDRLWPPLRAAASASVARPLPLSPEPGSPPLCTSPHGAATPGAASSSSLLGPRLVAASVRAFRGRQCLLCTRRPLQALFNVLMSAFIGPLVIGEPGLVAVPAAANLRAQHPQEQARE